LRAFADEFSPSPKRYTAKVPKPGLQARPGKFGMTRALHCYERVAYDEYELPNIATLAIEVDGSEIDMPLNRAYFCPLVDFRNDSATS
jgi:hypothetical protein